MDLSTKLSTREWLVSMCAFSLSYHLSIYPLSSRAGIHTGLGSLDCQQCSTVFLLRVQGCQE